MSAKPSSAHMGAWQEVIPVFLQLAARNPGIPSILHLAASLGRFFPSCHLIVLSCTTQEAMWSSWEGAGWRDEGEPWLMAQGDAERHTELFETLGQKIDASGYSLSFTTAVELPWVLVLDERPQSSASVAGKIGIVIQEAGVDLLDAMADRFVWLRRYLEGIPALATAFIAVSRAQETRLAWELARISDLRSAVANFVHSGAAGAARQLELGQQVEAKFKASLAGSTDREHLRLARDLAEATLQRLLGDGRDLRRGDDSGLDATDPLPFLKTLREIEGWRPAVPEDEGLRQSLWWLNLSLRSAIEDNVPDIPAAAVILQDLPDETRQGVLELAQLAFWSSVHQEALARLRADQLTLDDSAWDPWLHRIQVALGDLEKVLKNRFQHEDGSGLRVKGKTGCR